MAGREDPHHGTHTYLLTLTYRQSFWKSPLMTLLTFRFVLQRGGNGRAEGSLKERHELVSSESRGSVGPKPGFQEDSATENEHEFTTLRIHTDVQL